MDEINALVIAPDGLTLATASEGFLAPSTIQLWDISDPSAPRPFGPPVAIHEDTPTSLAFSPDGRTLAVGANADFDDEQGITFWDVSSLVGLRRDLVAVACQQAGGLSREEWD